MPSGTPSQKESALTSQINGEGTIDLRDDTKSSSPTLFESAAWQHVMEETYDFTFYQARHPDIPTALPFAVTESDLRKRAVSLPFSDYVVTDDVDGQEYRRLADVVRNAYPDHPLILKTTFPHDTDGLGAVERKAYYHRIPTPDHDSVDENVTYAFTKNVRKAKRNGVTTERSTSLESLATFYRMHRDLRFGKFGKIPQPKRFFRTIHDVFLDGEKGFVMKAMRKGTPIASLIAIRHGGVLFDKFSASVEEGLEYRPNDLLLHDLSHYAVDQGLQGVDLGLSGAGPSYRGLRRFKESAGAEPTPITTFRIDPPNFDEEAAAEFDEFLGDLTATVVDQGLDEEATDAFSESIYPYFA